MGGEMKPETNISYRINLDDLDFMGIVGHHQWIRLLERFRTEAMKDFYKGLLGSGLHLAVVHVDARYKNPAKYDEALSFTIRLAQKKRSTLHVFHEVRNEEGRLYLEADVTLACIDEQGRLCTLPEIV